MPVLSCHSIATVLAMAAATAAAAQGPIRHALQPGLELEAIEARRGAEPGAAGADVGTPSGSLGGPVAFWLHVLHNSDGESQIINAGAGALADYGGVARFKTLADALRAVALTYPADALPKGAVMISSGDNFLAGPEFNASLQLASPPYYDTIAMQLIGYDAATLGNHEFDFGPDVLQNFLAGFTAPLPFLSANLDFTVEPGLQAQVMTGRIAKRTVVNVAGELIGIVGATTTDLPFISTPRNVVVNAVLPAVQAEVDALVGLGVNKIIVSTHLQGIVSEFALAQQVRHVDIIIAGGGGELLANPSAVLVPGDTAFSTSLGGTGYPRLATDPDGRTVHIIGTRGDYRYIGRLVAGFDASGEIVQIDGISNPVRVSGVAPDAVMPDPLVQALVVDPVAAAVAALAANVVAVSEVGLDGRTTEVRARETNLGNICADSLLYAGILGAIQLGREIPDVALQNGGGIRNNSIIPAGNITELSTFEILPFSNFVSVVPNVPPQTFKNVLENAVSRIGGSGNGRYAQIAGFTFTFDFAQTAIAIDAAGNITTPGQRIREVVLNDGRVIVRDGRVVPGAPAINVAVNDFNARGGDQYVFAGAPFFNVGVSYQQAFRDFIQSSGFLGGVITNLDYPVGGQQRIRRLN